MSGENIVERIVERRKEDIKKNGYNQGFEIPGKRNRPVNPFMENRGVILEVKRASPSKGDIAVNLDSVAAAKSYVEAGAAAVSCLTEQNYFKGSLKDLISICEALPKAAVLRKDFLIDEQEIEVSYKCGADAVLLIAGILDLEKLISMASLCRHFGIRALLEVRTEKDVEKAVELKERFPDTIVCGVNSRNLKDFSVDILVPAMLKKKLGGKVIFESGIKTPDAAFKISSMGFSGILLGESAAKNPGEAKSFVEAFGKASENQYGKSVLNLAEKIAGRKNLPLVKICGLTRTRDLVLADSLGADFVGFIFAKEYARNVCGRKFENLSGALKDIRALKVAVITNAESDEALAAGNLVRDGVLDFIQVHGIPPENLPAYLKDVPHYFAVPQKTDGGYDLCERLNSLGEARFLQDNRERNYFRGCPLWMAGGINAGNVSSLIKDFSPELVDVSSGLEDGAAGEKNELLMKKFFEEIRHI